MFRVAGMRFVASMTMLFAIFHGLRAVDIGNRITAFAADGELLNTTELLTAIDLFSNTVDPGLTIGLIALFLAVVVAFFGFFAEVGEVVIRYTVFDMFAVIAIMVGVGVLRAFEWLGFSSVYVVATNLPAVEMYEELGADLASATITRGETSQVVRFADGRVRRRHRQEPRRRVGALLPLERHALAVRRLPHRRHRDRHRAARPDRGGALDGHGRAHARHRGRRRQGLPRAARV